MGKEHDDCESGKKAALATKFIVSLQEAMKKMEKTGCKPPKSVHCVCCDKGTGRTGGFDPETNIITLCENKMDGEDDAKVITIHEYIHAYDACQQSLGTCGYLACSEVRAYSFSGQCDKEGSGWRKKGETRADSSSVTQRRRLRSPLRTARKVMSTTCFLAATLTKRCLYHRCPSHGRKRNRRNRQVGEAGTTLEPYGAERMRRYTIRWITVWLLWCLILRPDCGRGCEPSTRDVVPVLTDIVSIECMPRRADTWRKVPHDKWAELLALLARHHPFRAGESHVGSQVPPFSYHLRIGDSDRRVVMLSFYVGDDMFEDDRSGLLYTLREEDGKRARRLCGVLLRTENAEEKVGQDRLFSQSVKFAQGRIHAPTTWTKVYILGHPQ